MAEKAHPRPPARDPNKTMEDYLPVGHIGRPLKYDPSWMLGKAVEILNDGGSMAEVAREFQITFETLNQWRKKYPEFSESIKKGKVYSECWWTKQGRTSMRDSEFNHVLWYMNMKNRFDWNDPKTTYRTKERKGYEGSLLKKSQALNRMVKKGEMSSDEHKDAMTALVSEAKILETYELNEKVDRLCAAVGLEKK